MNDFLYNSIIYVYKEIIYMKKEILKKLIEKGFSSRGIAKRLGLGRGTINYWLLKYNFKTKCKPCNSKKSKSKYNWKIIQRYYDKEHTQKEIIDKFGVSDSSILRARLRGEFKSRPISEANRISQKRHPRKHSEKTKRKISKIRKKYLKENPDKIPYLLNHYSKGPSYPEKYFSKLFKCEKIKLKQYYQVRLYQLDFACPKKKIDIEIDGNQHRADPRIVKHDKERSKNLKKDGWKIFRIFWSDYQKKSYEEKHKIIEKIKSMLK